MRTKLLILVAATAFSVSAVSAQSDQGPKAPSSTKAATVSEPKDIAQLAFAAHGGDKLKALKTLVIRGSADITSFGQAIPASFVTIIAGERYYFEVNNPFQPLKQIYDGRQVFSSLQGFSLPPITSLGFPLLTRIGDEGYVISAAGDPKRKQRGFRVSTPDGFYTDFYIDDKTNQIKSYESSYLVGDRTVTTSVIVDESLSVDGLLVPRKYSQRFDLGGLTAYSNFKAKDILVNSEVKDDVFSIPR